MVGPEEELQVSSLSSRKQILSSSTGKKYALFIPGVLVIKLSVPPIWIYIPSDAQLSPHRLVYLKVYVDMENLFLF